MIGASLLLVLRGLDPRTQATLPFAGPECRIKSGNDGKAGSR